MDIIEYDFDRAPPKVLVVDDDPQFNELCMHFLNSENFTTFSADSVQSALRMLESGVVIDIIILDYQLGDGNGMEVLSAPAYNTLSVLPPVIMISAHDGSDFFSSCFAGGVADFIVKPINLTLLAIKVKVLLSSIALQRQIADQNKKLEFYKAESMREEKTAQLTYEYLLRKNSRLVSGVSITVQPLSFFSGDVAIAKCSPSGSLFFMLADATGHGLSAAITIMPVVTTFNTMVEKGIGLSRIITEINRKLINEIPIGRFVAAIFVELNQAKNTLSVWNGGMPHVYWVDNNEIVHSFQSRNMALGIMDEFLFDAIPEVVPMPGSGFIFAHSDGLNEQMNDSRQYFSAAKVQELLRHDVPDIRQLMMDELQRHAGATNFDDDVSVCVLQPDIIFSSANDPSCLACIKEKLTLGMNEISWCVKLIGDNLANLELPLLCNNFMQNILLDQRDCQKVFAVVSEMVSNGLDHGVLGLSSAIKDSPDGIANYFSQRADRLKNLSEDDYVELEIRCLFVYGKRQIILTCRDSGEGFDVSAMREPQDDGFSGRGLLLISKLSTSMKIIPPGNQITALL